MFVIPPAIIETIENVDWEELLEQAQECRPAMDIVQKTWDKETLAEMIDGKVSVPDSVINDAVAEKLDPEGNVKSVKVTSRENGRLEILADTKRLGRIELSGEIERFVHNSEESVVTYRVRERALKDHGLGSWLFSRVSLSLAEKVLGKVEIDDKVPVNIKGNRVNVDFHELANTSELASHEVFGHRLIDMVEIEEAVPHDGYIVFKTNVNLPDEVKNLVKDYLKDLSKSDIEAAVDEAIMEQKEDEA